MSADQENSVQIYFPREMYASDRILGLSFVCDKMPIWFFAFFVVVVCLFVLLVKEK